MSIENPSDLVRNHYAVWVRRDTPNRFPGLTVALEQLNGRQAIIVETGSSAWGIDSSRLFDSYVRQFGGQFFTIDLRSGPSDKLKGQLGANSECIVSDSIEGLLGLADRLHQVDFLYLDSLDLDWASPESSATHCLREWHAARTMLRPGSVVVIDDTPANLSYVPEFDRTSRKNAERYFKANGLLPGKGALVMKEIADDPGVEILHHTYNLVFRIC